MDWSAKKPTMDNENTPIPVHSNFLLLLYFDAAINNIHAIIDKIPETMKGFSLLKPKRACNRGENPIRAAEQKRNNKWYLYNIFAY